MDDLIFWFDKKYKQGLSLGGRDQTMRKALELLLERKKTQGIIVETGCVRMKDDWGAGMSTLIFADFCKRYNFHLFSCDNSPKALETAKEVTKEFAPFITFVENDSITFLKNFNQKIDLLYLDSMDCPEYDATTSLALLRSQAHQLDEIVAATNKLADSSITLLDDNQFENFGKTRLSKMFLKEDGFGEIMSGKQSLWVKP